MIEAITEDAAAKEDALPARRRGAARRRDPRVEHELDPDHVARGGHRAAGAGDRDALLQPGAGAEARRGDPRRADLRRDGGRDRRSSPASSGRSPRRRTTFPGFVSNRILMPFINEAAYALMEGVAEAGGDRHDREARVRAPDGAARARRPDRPRHVRRDHGRAARAASATRSTRRARCCASTCRRAGSAGSQAAGSTRTSAREPSALRAPRRRHRRRASTRR